MTRHELSRAARRVLGPVLPAVRRLRTLPALARGRAGAARLSRVASDDARVCFVAPRFPAPPARRDQFATGGAVKLTYLAERFGHARDGCNVLYAVSSVQHPAVPAILRAAARERIPLVLNQNGVYYRGWYGGGWAAQNRPLAAVHAAADVVIYQSEFCRHSAHEHLGAPRGESHVLFNPVDLVHYRPRSAWDGTTPPVLLALAGHEDRAYRLECAVQVLARVRREHPDATLRIPGFAPTRERDAAMIARVRAWAEAAAVPVDAIAFPPPFTRLQAPDVIGAAHVVVHAQYQDSSPNFVCEALACGVPVAYSASGGVPELVGPDAGVGVAVPHSWTEVHVPRPEEMAEGVLRLLADWPARSAAARRRAEARFALPSFLDAHAAIFARLVA